MFRFTKKWSQWLCVAMLAHLPATAAQKGASLSQVNWSAVVKLDEKALASLPLDSELLAAAYEELFMDQIEGSAPDWYMAIRKDLERRGNSAIPVLLSLFDKSVDGYREGLLFNIEDYPAISVEPFLNAARNYWKQNKLGTRRRLCYAISRLLSRRGNASDLSILKEMKGHPVGEVSFVIQPDILRMEKRLNGTLEPSEWTGRPPDGYQWPAQSSHAKPLSAVAPASGPNPMPATSWSIFVVLIVAAVGLLWLLMKKRK